MKRKICIITTNRAEFGQLKKLVQLIKRSKKSQLQLVVTGSHLEKKYGYTIKWKILNTKDYGIPQNRERMFIVGCKNKDFEWPKKIKMKPLEKYIDYKDKNKYNTTRKYFSKIFHI